MSADTRARLEDIHTLLASGQRSIRIERHTLFLWGVAGALLIFATDWLFTRENFTADWIRNLLEAAFLAVVLTVVGVVDIRLTRRNRRRRDETLSFVQVQITKVWWMLVGLIVVLNLGMGFFGGGYMIYGVILTLIGIAFYVQGLFSERLLAWSGVLLMVLGLASVALQMPFQFMEWLAASILGLGFPALAFMLNRANGSTFGKDAVLSTAWLLLVVTPPTLGFQLIAHAEPPEAPLLSLESYQTGGATQGPRIVELPVGTVVPVQIRLDGDVLAATSEATLNLTLAQPLRILVENETPVGPYQVGDGAWQLNGYRFRVHDLKLEPTFTHAQGPAVEMRMRMSGVTH